MRVKYLTVIKRCKDAKLSRKFVRWLAFEEYYGTINISIYLEVIV